ncbi:MAG: ribonuclease R [Cyclobacteriaceae bacterium]|nr:ribonuclease R [Cyclobacteriaceae bacterium]
MSKKRKKATRSTGESSPRMGDKRKFDPKVIKAKVLDYLDSNISKAYSSKQLIKRLNIRDSSSKASVQPILEMLEREGKIERLRNSYKSLRKAESVKGIVDHVNARFAYVVTDTEHGDIWVKTDLLKNAMNGDTVEVMVFPKRHGKRPEGQVEKIITRKTTELVGKIEFSTRYAFVVPDNRKIHIDVFVPLNKVMNANHKDKVIIKINKWPSHGQNPEGEVIRVLGPAGKHEAEMHSIMAEFGLPFEFPNKVEAEANKLNNKLPADEIKKRKDFRPITTFTIDPLDAKDFDDAISYKTLKSGNVEVGIHIADVTHYVRPKTTLEEEAVKRATSVYLVDRTIPMLPEHISNGLCSLRPNEDKFTFSAVFELTPEAQIAKEWFGRTVIHSNRRFTYEEAQQGIETQKGDFAEELNALNTLAKTLKKERSKRGAINFETTEVRFELAEDGTPLRVVPKVRVDAHKLVEEFMLLANKRVAQYVFDLHKGKERDTFVYRTHDNPDPEKINTFATFAKRFGHEIDVEGNQISNSINALIAKIEGKPEENVLQSLAIRSMAKAKYTTEANGHFGLAFTHYTHFTSPIRRYPDMMVHRLLQHYLSGGKSVNEEDYEELCLHSSDMEKRAAEAERASIKYKQVEFMQNAEKKPYEGVITGLTEWGIFVEITETKCEGMVRMSEMSDDFYEFDEDNYRIIGKRNKKMLSLGDKVVVEVIDTNIDRRTIDLVFVNLSSG